MDRARYFRKKTNLKVFILNTRRPYKVKPTIKLKLWLTNVANIVFIIKRRDCKIMFVSKKLNIPIIKKFFNSLFLIFFNLFKSYKLVIFNQYFFLYPSNLFLF